MILLHFATITRPAQTLCQQKAIVCIAKSKISHQGVICDNCKMERLRIVTLKIVWQKVRCVGHQEDASSLGREVTGKWENNVVRKVWRGRSEGRQRAWSRKEEGFVPGKHLDSNKEKTSVVLFGTVGLSRWAGSCRIWKALGKQGFQVAETSPRFFRIFFELTRCVESTSFRHQHMAPLRLRARGSVF